MQNHGIEHLRTAYYSPQANASERVNPRVLAAIRSHVTEDQTIVCEEKESEWPG